MARASDEFPLPAGVIAEQQSRALTAASTGPSTAAAALPAPFLTRPYLGWHSLNSYFDHCSPDYGVDNQICTVDGVVAKKANGFDPSFPKGYATAPRGTDYVYYDGHNGFDLGLSYETLLAAAPGTVEVAGVDSVNPCFGLNVVIDHGNGFATRYAHMERVDVAVGQRVLRGSPIGVSGTTGCSTGPHLHFGLYTTNPWIAIDPWGWLGTPGTDPYPFDMGDMWLGGNPQDPLPQAPLAAAAVLAGSSATVTWAPGFDGGEPFDGYTVQAAPGGATVHVAGTALTAVFLGLQLGTTYTFTVTAHNREATSPASLPTNPVTPVIPPTTHYFAEGFTGPGYAERLRLFMPDLGGPATIDYYTATGHTQVPVQLTAGHALVASVNDAVGAGQDVSIKVTLPGPGVVEREIDYQTPAWHGSERQVGVPAPLTTWYFAEGSTLDRFDEYLALMNPQPNAVTVAISYITDGGRQSVSNVEVAAGRRLTIRVFDPAVGVGRGVGGVSMKVVGSAPIVAERSFYVNGFDFGSGPIRDGHDAFGVNALDTSWYFAEGTTQAGFYEYLTLQNPNPASAAVSLRYLDTAGLVSNRQVTISPHSRFTVFVNDPGLGVGPGIFGVSVQVTSSLPIAAERPLYLATSLGGGIIAGADVAPGVQSAGRSFTFAGGSTLPGDSDFLTIANTGTVATTVTLTYFGTAGQTVRSITIPPATRHTVVLAAAGEGVGPGAALDGILLASSEPVVVEKVTYSFNADRYGASATFGWRPAAAAPG